MGVRSMLSTSRAATKSLSVKWPSPPQDRSWRSGLDSVRPSSGMLRRYRRFFAVAAFLVLATPLVVGLVKPDSAASILKEGRNPAPTPNAPDSPGDWLTLPKEIDAYLKDRFGLRQAMIRLHKDLTRPLWVGESDVALIGASGRMYALPDDMVAQSAGRAFRPQKVAEAANMVAAMNDALARRGVKFLVALPPNSSTIYQDDLPGWARNPGKKTEYDLLLEELAARGVKTVDLRPALKKARASGATYLLNDLHWNVSGALAGFNAVVEADGHPDWAIDPSAAIGPLTERKGGDIATVAGVADKAVEDDPIPRFAARRARRAAVSRPRGSYRRRAGYGRPRHCVGQARSDDHGDRRFFHGRVFSTVPFAARRPGRLVSPRVLRFRLGVDRQDPAGRSLVDAG